MSAGIDATPLSTDLERSLQALSRETGQAMPALRAEAQACFAEFRSDRRSFWVGVFAALSRFVCRRGYEQRIVCDEGEFARVAALAGAGPVVYLITHKTYLDIFVLYHALYSRGIATPYVFGGINMDFFGLGALSRRAGGIFIRREFRDAAVYKLALRDYVAGLLEAGASFMWAIEGTRSRTGKLVMPRLGLLKYVVGASRRRDPEAVKYLPVSISYDQIPDVAEMTAQQLGVGKRPESLAWFLRYLRGLKKPLGRIYLRFGEPVSLHETPDAPRLEGHGGESAETLEVQKLAFEICFLINRVTPPTTLSLALMGLLGRDGVGDEWLAREVAALFGYVRRHRPEAVKGLSADGAAGLESTIASLQASGLVVASPDGRRRRLRIPPEQHLAALYYANMAAHHFVIAAFVELALVRAAEVDAAGARAEFWADIDRLRELFKMEFFFSRKTQYRADVAAELAEHTASWSERLDGGGASVLSLLDERSLFVAQGVLRPLVEAYRVVAAELLRLPAAAGREDALLTEQCMALGRTMAARGEIRWPDAASRALLANGILLARNRRLVADGNGGLHQRRQAFDAELQDLLRRLERLERLERRLLS